MNNKNKQIAKRTYKQQLIQDIIEDAFVTERTYQCGKFKVLRSKRKVYSAIIPGERPTFGGSDLAFLMWDKFGGVVTPSFYSIGDCYRFAKSCI